MYTKFRRRIFTQKTGYKPYLKINVDNNNQPLALFCDCDGFEVSLTGDGLSVKTDTSVDFFPLAEITRLQIIAHADNTPGGLSSSPKQKNGRFALPILVLIITVLCLIAGSVWRTPFIVYAGIAALIAGAVLLARFRTRLKKESLLCYLRVELTNHVVDYPFEGNTIKRMDMSKLETHFNLLKTTPVAIADGVS